MNELFDEYDLSNFKHLKSVYVNDFCLTEIYETPDGELMNTYDWEGNLI